MSLTTRYGLVAGTTALAIAGTAFGGAESDNDALAQIAELKQELAELKQQDGQDWLTEQRASEIRGIVQDVLADADTRTSLQNSGAMAGYNNGFFLASPDGNFKLNVQGFMQVRWTLNSANGPAAAFTLPNGRTIPQRNVNTKWGFENADTYLDFSGNVVDPSWKFKVRGNFANDEAGNSGNMGLSFAYIEKDLGDGLSVRVGQFRAPWLREELVDDPYQLGVDRSVFNSSFTQGFSQGIQVGYEADAFRVDAWYGDGFGPSFDAGTFQLPVIGNVNIAGAGYNTANTAWTQNTTKWSFAARGEYKISGDWSTFDDFTSFRGEEGGMMVGVAVRGQVGSGTTNDFSFTDDAEIFGVTADFTWDFGGANLYAAFVYQDIDWGNQNAGGTPVGLGSSTQYGFMVQGGYFVTEEIEIYGRYDYINYGLDQDVTVAGVGYKLSDILGNTKYNGLTIGANYFFAPNVKATVEWGYNFDSLSSLTPNLTNSGFRPDVTKPGGQRADGQWALRAQLQLLF